MALPSMELKPKMKGDYKVTLHHDNGSFETLEVREEELIKLLETWEPSPYVRREGMTFKVSNLNEVKKGDRLSLSPKEESK